MKKSEFTRSVEKRLLLLAPKTFSGKFKPEDYLKGNGLELSRLKFLNLSMPTIRGELATIGVGESLFRDMQKIWHESEIFDVKTLPVCWLDEQSTAFLVENYKSILDWAELVDNWAHADGLCSVYARMCEAAPKKVLPIYTEWNKHKNPWLRRCSMVGTFYYSRNRKKQISFALAKKLVSPHLGASEYYVQKAVGWTIREMYNVYPDETIRYIESNLARLTSVAWVAASEKLKPSIKNPLLQRRKKLRQKSRLK